MFYQRLYIQTPLKASLKSYIWNLYPQIYTHKAVFVSVNRSIASPAECLKSFEQVIQANI